MNNLPNDPGCGPPGEPGVGRPCPTDKFLEVFGPGTRGRELTSPPVVAFEVEDVAAAREELLLHGVGIVGDVGSWNGFEWQQMAELKTMPN